MIPDPLRDAVVRELRIERDLDLRMGSILDLFEARRPGSDWTTLRWGPWRRDAERLESWFARLLETEPPLEPVGAFWFGLLNPPGPDGRTTSDFYVCATRAYEPGPDRDWAGSAFWFPEERSAGSIALDHIHRGATRGDGSPGDEAAEALALAYLAFAVAHVLARADLAGLSVRGNRAGVAVGSDVGPCLHVGWVESGRFRTGP